MQSGKASMQILSPSATSERSVVDKRTQSFSVEKCFNATNGNATKRSTDNHKSDAAYGELMTNILSKSVQTPFISFRLQMLI